MKKFLLATTCLLFATQAMAHPTNEVRITFGKHGIYVWTNPNSSTMRGGGMHVITEAHKCVAAKGLVNSTSKWATNKSRTKYRKLYRDLNCQDVDATKYKWRLNMETSMWEKVPADDH